MIAENQAFLSFCETNATKFGSKNTILHIIMYHYMTSYDYIIMLIVDSCMIWFDFDCIMQLKNSLHIATNVCSGKSATTFGDLPDWWGMMRYIYIHIYRSHGYIKPEHISQPYKHNLIRDAILMKMTRADDSKWHMFDKWLPLEWISSVNASRW